MQFTRKSTHSILLPSSAALVQSVQSMSLSVTPAQTAAWRRQIFEQLNERTRREMDNFKHYEQAVEQVPELKSCGHHPPSSLIYYAWQQCV